MGVADRRAFPRWGAMLAAVSGLGVAGLGAESLPVDFDREVRPLLAEHCFKCHGVDARKRKAKLRLDQRDGVLGTVKPGRPTASELLRRVTTADEDQRMPPAATGPRLTPDQIGRVRRWIAEGAVWSEHWSLRPVSRPPVPEVAKPGWPRNAIDRFVLAGQLAAGLSPSGEADPARLVRRVTLDLLGLPATPEEVDAVLTDRRPGWYERLVDRLLASPRFGERLARVWLDLARYADTDGYQDDEPRVMWRWRDWVIDAINDNQPFDHFTIEQLAGDLLPKAKPRQVLATGFNRNNRTNGEGGSIAEEFRVEYIVDRVDTLSTTWMGLTLSCARCHDHKYDPLTQRDFYRLFAFYNNIPEKGTYRRNSPPLLKVPTRTTAAELSAIEAERKGLAKDDPRRPVLEKRHRQLLDAVPTTMVLREGPPRKTFILVRGQYDRRGEQVTAGVPAALPALADGQPANRLGLARWLVDRRHPLTSRVAVNRFWQMFFGRGLVTTPEDFGVQGNRPSHPRLLDWLAAEFIDVDWDVKELVRRIVTSSTYRQSSRVAPGRLEVDPENRWLARAPRLRLSAEAIRDQALAVSGLLNEQLGGPSVKPHQPDGLWKEIAGGASGAYRDGYQSDKGPGRYRRSLYTFWRRTIPPALMATFDAPSRESCTVRRGRTNTPLQALALMNDVVFVEAARHLAARVAVETSVSRRIDAAFRRVLGRTAVDREREILQRGYDRYLAFFSGDPESAKRFLQGGPVLAAAEGNIPGQAAFVAVCHVLLNLDETVNRE